MLDYGEIWLCRKFARLKGKLFDEVTIVNFLLMGTDAIYYVLNLIMA